MSIAMSGHLGLKKETTYGVEVTPNVFGEITNESITVDSALRIPRVIGGIRGNKRILPGRLEGSGGFNYMLFPRDLTGWILRGLFGTCVTTDLGLGAYQHVFTPQASSALPSFTIQKDAEGGCFNYLGCVMSGFNLSLTPDELPEMAVDLIPQRVKEATAATPSYAGDDPFFPEQAVITLNGTVVDLFESIDFSITNEVEGVATLNNKRYIGKAVAKQFDTNGSMTIEFDNMDYLRRVWGSAAATEPLNCLTSGSLEIEFEQSCSDDATYGIIGTSAYKNKLTFAWHEIYFSGSDPQLSGADDRVMQTIAFDTKYNTVNSAMLTVTLINGVASYA